MVHMPLAMSRPVRDRNGVWCLRKRVPKDLHPHVGKTEEKRSLGTKDLAEAKHRYPAVLAEVEARWANLRARPRSLTEREAQRLARPIFDNWLTLHRENPSEQYEWHPHLYATLWTEADPPGREPEPGQPGEICIDTIFRRYMRMFSLKQADYGLAEYGLEVDEWSRFKFAKAIAAALQRASLVLEQEANGIHPGDIPDPVLDSPTLRATALRRVAADEGRNEPRGLTVTGLLEAWWEEAKAAGRKGSTHESYRNT